MDDRQRAKLQAACDYVGNALRLKRAPADIIAGLVREHGAACAARSDGYKLRCAGVAASCTWSADTGLLGNWRKTATLHLMQTA